MVVYPVLNLLCWLRVIGGDGAGKLMTASTPPTIEEQRAALKSATVAWLRYYSPTKKYPSRISATMTRDLVATLKQIDRVCDNMKAGAK